MKTPVMTTKAKTKPKNRFANNVLQLGVRLRNEADAKR